MVATDYTLEFVQRYLPKGATDILEVGCGSGELASRLGELGLRVVAVDSDETCVCEAKQRGVDARVLSWPGVVEGEFDAVLFTRSLHHIHDLHGAVSAAVAALRPGGWIIVEDFRAEGGSEAADRWFAHTIRRLHSSAALRATANVAAILDRARPADPEHELHSSEAIAAALAAHGEVDEADAAYYFRYVEPELASSEAAAAVLDEELARIGNGTIDALGKRFILQPVP